MNHSKVIVSSLLAALVVAGLLLIGSTSASNGAVATSSGSGPVKPVPWKRG